jgi:uncharacterized protein (TIGR02996 family)
LFGCASAAGCRLLGDRGPVSNEMAACRELSQQGLSAIERADWQAAEACFAQAIKAQPNDATARRHYADVLWRRGAQQQGLVQAEEALRLSSDDPAIAARVGEMNLMLGKIDEAGRLANAALDAHPTAASGWALRARVAAHEGRHEEALADLHRALEQSPADRQLLLEIAEVHRAMNRPQRALAALAALQETYPPGEAPAHVLHLSGLALSAVGRHADAVDAYLAAIESKGPSAELLTCLAEGQLRCGDVEAASHTAEQALAMDPRHAMGRAIWEQIEGVRTASAPVP